MRWPGRSIVVLVALVLVASATATAGIAAGSRGAHIPRQARVLELTVRRLHHGPSTDLAVTRLGRVRAIASLIDALTPLGPGALDCTEKGDDPVVTFTFRAAPGGRVLARARQIVEIGVAGGASCEPMTLTVNGRPQTPLVGGTKAVRTAQRLLGVNLIPR